MARSLKKPYLTKSRHLAGLRCAKLLWLGWHQRLPYEDAPLGSPMAMGIEVGQKAWKLFPGGVVVDEAPWEHEAAIARTRELMMADVPAIFEGAFEHDGVRIRADILERLPDGLWSLHEVKSSGRVKDEHLIDLALQVHILQGSGVNLSSYGVLHINTGYVRRKRGIEWRKLFVRADLTGGIDDTLKETPSLIAENHRILRKRKVPKIAMTKACGGCDYWDHCAAGKPDDWIYYLYAITSNKFDELTESGIESITEIPDVYPLSGIQMLIRKVLITGKEYISEGLTKALLGSGPPSYYLDFETMGPAIPLYAGTRPYQAVPFQWSLHRLNRKGKLNHSEFLAKGDSDPQRDFAESLIKAVGTSNQPIMVYSSFEKRILTQLEGQFPDLKALLNAIIERLFDLLHVTRNNIYHPDFYGSFSIKSVGPALVPELSYDKLDGVADGMAASASFEAMATGRLSNALEISIQRQGLLDYCKLDTLALVEVHRLLREKSSKVA